MNESDDPARIVSEFIAEMNKWELSAWQSRRSVKNSSDPASYQPIVHESLRKVFDLFCTAKDRPYGRQDAFSNPPEYDPAKERIVGCQIEGKRAFVETERTASLGGGRYRYVLIRVEHRWLIDDLEFLEGEKWERAIL